MGSRTSLPRSCPDCGTKLTIRDKGQARYSPWAKALMLLAVVPFGVYLWRTELRPYRGAVMLLVFLISGFAYSLPKIARYRCRRCGWTKVYRLGRRRARAADAV